LKSHRRKWIAVAVFLLGSTCLFSQQTNSRLAFQYYNDQEWEKAAPLFQEMYKNSQAKPYLNYYVRCLIELEEFDQAERELKRVLRKKNDVTINIDLAHLYELSGRQKLADQHLEKPFSNFPRTTSAVKVLGNSYITYGKYEFALRCYEIGRAVLNQPDEFHMDLASIYSLMRRHDKMVDEYLALLLTQPRYLRSVQNQLQSALTHDIDGVLIDLVHQKTLSYLQQFPGLDIFTEMLIWVSLQKSDYNEAVAQAMALDFRNRETGSRLLELARLARESEEFEAAITAYQFIIDKGPPQNEVTPTPMRAAQTPLEMALTEKVQTQLQQLEHNRETSVSAYQELADLINSTGDQLRSNTLKAALMKDLAYIQTYYLYQYEMALIQLDSALNLPGINPVFKADCLLAKGNTLLISGDPWSATFVYARVEKENTQNPTGSLAKFRKAQLAYFTGDFRWALSQLDVLKGSSSKLIANDAFELALLIRENQEPGDSLGTALKTLARAEYLAFQKKPDQCMLTLDSLIQDENASWVRDDALFKKAELLLEGGQVAQAIALLNEVSQTYRYDIWGHKALYKLGEEYFNKQDYEEAQRYYQEIKQEFPNSFYHLDARNRIREIRQLTQGDQLNNENK